MWQSDGLGKLLTLATASRHHLFITKLAADGLTVYCFVLMPTLSDASYDLCCSCPHQHVLHSRCLTVHLFWSDTRFSRFHKTESLVITAVFIRQISVYS